MSATSYKAVYTVAGTEAQTAVSYSLTATDQAGNVTTVTSGASGSVTIDYTAPAVNLVSILSNNANHAYAADGNVITLSFTASDTNLNTVSGSIDSNNATIANTGNNYTAKWTVVPADPDAPVTYSVTVTDKAGNSTSVNTGLTTVTIDRTTPILTLVSIVSNNANPIYATTGNVITLTYNVGGTNFNTPTVTFASKPATTNTTSNGSDYTATYTVTSGDTQGLVSYNVTVTTFAGKSVNSTSLANGSTDTVTIDTVAPTFSVGTITTSGNTGYAKTGNTITVNFTAVETGLGFASGSPGATIDGQTATITGTYPNYTASYTIIGSEPETTAQYVINGADKAGNANSISASTGILVDHTAPTINSVSIASNHSGYTAWGTNGDTITLGIMASDTGAGLNSASVIIGGKTAALGTGSQTYTYTYTLASGDGVPDGVTSYSVTVTDKAGNSTTVQTGSTGSTTITGGVTVDRTGPTLALTSFATSTGTHNTAYANNTDTVDLVFTAKDASVGITAAPVVTISVNGANGKGTLTQPTAVTVAGGTTQSYTGKYALSASDTDGPITYLVTATDALGNSQVSTLIGGGVTFYQTVPTIASVNIANTVTGSASYTNASLTITLGTVTVNASGIYSKQYREGIGGTWTPLPTDGKVTLVTTSGSLVVQVQVTDNAGNATMASASAITVETTTPTVATPTVANTVTGSASYTNASLTITLGTVTVNASGIYSKQYREGTGGTWTPLPTDGKVTLVTTSGSLVVQVQVTDNAGNATMASASAITVETTTPTVATPTVANTVTGNTSYTNASLTITAGAVTGISSGVYLTQYREGTGGTWTTLPANGKVTLSTSSGSLVIQEQVTSNAGNVSSIESASAITVETTTPTVATPTVANTVTGNTSYTNASLTITAGAVSGISSGVYLTQYREGTGGTWTTLPANGKVTLSTSSGSLVIQEQVTSNAGNVSSIESASAITVETTTPTVATPTVANTVTGSASYTNTSLTITAGAVSGISSGVYLTQYREGTSGSWTTLPANGKVTLATTSGSLVIQEQVTSNAGNVSSIESASAITVETTTPTVATPTVANTMTGSASYTNTSLTITAGAVTGISSGVYLTQYREGTGGTWTTLPANGKVTLSTSSGSLVIQEQVTSNAGNVSSIESASAITVETTTPAVATPTVANTVTGNTSYTNASLTITAGAVTGISSGVYLTQYREGTGGTWTTLPANGKVTLSTSSGSLVIQEQVTSNAGNVSSIESASAITVETTTPTVATPTVANTMTGNTSYTNASLTITAGAVTGISSGVYLTQYREGTGGTWTTLPANGKVTLSTSSGSLVIQEQVTSNAGNVSSIESASAITVETTTPTVGTPTVANTVTGSASYTNASLTITLGTVTVNASGIYSKQYREGTGGTWTPLPTDGKVTLVTTSGSLVVQVQVTDNAGNATMASASAITVETTTPTVATPTVANTVTGNTSYTNASLTITAGVE